MQDQLLSSLRNRLEVKLNSEFVKSASMILRNSSQGEIKLILRPKNLGSIRMKLAMSNGNLNGSIIVDNFQVKEIFESNLQLLTNSFTKEGIDVGDLEVYAGDKENSSDNSKKKNSFKQDKEENNLFLIEEDLFDNEINIIT